MRRESFWHMLWLVCATLYVGYCGHLAAAPGPCNNQCREIKQWCLASSATRESCGYYVVNDCTPCTDPPGGCFNALVLGGFCGPSPVAQRIGTCGGDSWYCNPGTTYPLWVEARCT